MDKKIIENKILCGDVLEKLREIPDETVSLIFTSPPYNCDIKYSDHEDTMRWQDYLDWLFEVWKECCRTLRPGGRLGINFDLVVNHEDDTEYFRPLHAELVSMMRKIDGMKFRNEIMWCKASTNPKHSQVVGRATAWGCYDDKTRVMTDSGWKYFKDIDASKDLFATINIDSREVEYQKCTGVINKEYKGEMYRVKSKTLDLLVTPNHNMLVENKHTKSLQIKQVQDCPKSFSIPQVSLGKSDTTIKDVKTFYLPKVEFGKRTNKDYINKAIRTLPMDDWLSFLGIFLTDGNVDYSESRRNYRISIYQSKSAYMKEIKDLLERLPWEFKYKESKDEWFINDKTLANYLNNFSCKNERKLPGFILKLNNRQKRIFLDWLFIGDGWKGKQERIAVCSGSFTDSLSKMLCDLGITFSINKRLMQSDRIYKGKIFKSNRQINVINIKKSKNYEIRKSNVSKTHYEGKVYCVEVPNHTLLVERNGRVTWCGNSWLLCSDPTVMRNHEQILVWSKGSYVLEGDSEMSDMTKEEFLEWTRSTWLVSPETDRKRGHPAPFPEELAKRMIKLYTYRGDLVLDPFNGSGTTVAVAAANSRRYLGIDVGREYCNRAEKRVKAILNKKTDLFEEYVPRSKRMKSYKKTPESPQVELFGNEEN